MRQRDQQELQGQQEQQAESHGSALRNFAEDMNDYRDTHTGQQRFHSTSSLTLCMMCWWSLSPTWQQQQGCLLPTW